MTPPNPTSRGALLTIFITVFIDLLGIGIIIPIIAPLFLEPNALLPASYTDIQRTQLMGLMISMFPLMTFFSAPFLGSLSDKYGRKQILFLSLFATVASYLMIAFGVIWQSLWMIFASRALLGLAAGNLSVIYSAIADVSDPAAKTRNFGLVGTAFGLGFIVGPIMGGNLSNSNLVPWFNFATPFFASAVLAGINLVMVWLFFQETHHTRDQTLRINLTSGFNNIGQAFNQPAMRLLFVTILIFSFSFTLFTQFFQVYLIKRLGYTQTDIGFVFGYIGMIGALTQGGLVRILSRRFQPQQVLPVVLLTLAGGYLLTLVPTDHLGIYLAIPFVAISQGIIMPNFSSIVSNSAPPHLQGQTLGMQQSVTSLGQFFAPLIGGYISGIAPRNTTLLAAGVMTFGWIIFMLYRHQQKTQAS
ncbi:MAG: MFS transporter [Bacteroidia bacterium]|nr:MFS transporter [Bacteroidia bacterium]